MCVQRSGATRILVMLVAVAVAGSTHAANNGPTRTNTSISALFGDDSLVSAAKQDIQVIRFSHGGNAHRPRVLVQAGLHGDESLGPAFVEWLVARYSRKTGSIYETFGTLVDIDFLPSTNPDGILARQRLNRNGVNLNRNFGILWGISRENPGKHKFSEPETRAIAKLLAHERYMAAVDLHGYVNWIVAPSEPTLIRESQRTARFPVASGKDSGNLVAAVPNERSPVLLERETIYWKWIKALQKAVRRLPGYELQTAGNLGDGGAFEDWAFWGNGTLTYCLEMRQIPRDPRWLTAMFLQYESEIAKTFSAAWRIDRADEIPATLSQSNKKIKIKTDVHH